ncbi:uncharacterized protein PpBr36_10188 [Pyricularia pennisetigena]|uniref:uncharacterized protein n=1 Tax=Pyricularia pennisetigena TaxID=1578925 RepID=UPI0011545080|nr:uncharacterized protein PpBr36_10188 [Pyricularia pennisetigena]TLS21301.1 hypothetical protein PpBr36_10188 [Pyricularia pennisetigena]
MTSDYLSDYQEILRNRPLPPPPSQTDDHVRQIEVLRTVLESKYQAAAKEEWALYQADKQSLEAERAERQRLFDAALDGVTHDAAWQETILSFQKSLVRYYEQRKLILFDKYKKIEQQRAARRKTEEQALNNEIYERITSKRRQSMTTAQNQEKTQPLSIPRAVAPRTPAETPPPLNSSSPTLGRRQSTSDASSNPPESTSFVPLTEPHHSDVPPPPPAGQSDGPKLAMTTSQKVSESVVLPPVGNFATLQVSHNKALEPISPVDTDDLIDHDASSQAKLLPKRARKDDMSPSNTKRARTGADHISQESYSIDAKADAADQTPVAKVVHNPKGSTTLGTIVPDIAQDLKTEQDSFVQTSRTITMEEIRSDKSYGKQRYHYIIQEDGNFWIAKCTEHGVHFGKNVKQGAAKHLNGKAHGLSRKRDQILHMLGYRITDCTEKLAKENNEKFEAKLKNGYKPLNLTQRGKQNHVDFEDMVSSPKMAHQLPEPKKGLQPSSVSGTRPVAGDLWVGYFEREQVHYGVRILPLVANSSDPGLLPVGRTKLFTDATLPSCYISSGPDDIRWAPGYEDGGPRVKERQYPVLVFDGDETYDWISLANLTPFDLERKDKKVSRWRRARDEYARLRGYKDYSHMQTDFGRTRTNRRLSEYPVPGKMYATQYNENGVFGVMVLPWLPELAEECPKTGRDLMDRLLKVDRDGCIPTCYLTTPESEISGWACDYRDGEISVPDRSYPVLWFDSEMNVGWVSGSALLGFDFENDHCGQDKIQKFNQARMEYAKIFGYRNYADMKAKAGVPETMSRPISAGIILDSDSESGDSDSEPDTEDLDKSTMEGQVAEGVEEIDLDVDADDQTTGSGTSDDDDMLMDLDLDKHQPASIEKVSEPGVTAATDSGQAMKTRQTSPATGATTLSVASNLQPKTKGAYAATTKGVPAVPAEATSQSVPVRSVADSRAQSMDGLSSTGRPASAQHKSIQKQPQRATSVPSVAPGDHLEVDRAKDLEKMRRARLKLKKTPPCIGPRPNASWVIVPQVDHVDKPAKSQKAVSNMPPLARHSPHPPTAAPEAVQLAQVPAVTQPHTPVQASGITTHKPQTTGSQSGSSGTMSVINAPPIASTTSSKTTTSPQALALRMNPNLAPARVREVTQPSDSMITSQPSQTLMQSVVTIVKPPESAGLPPKPANRQAAAQPKAAGPKVRTIDVGARMPIAPMSIMDLREPEAQNDVSAPAGEGRGQSRELGVLQQSSTPVSFLMQTARNALKVGKPAAAHEPGSMANSRPTNATLTSSATPSLSALRKELDSEPLMLCAYSSAATEAQLAENQQTFAAESLLVAIDHSCDVVKSVSGSPIHILVRPREVKRFVMERFDDGTGRATLFMGDDEPVQRLHFANMPGENNKKPHPGWRSCSFLRGYVEGFDTGVIVERI